MLESLRKEWRTLRAGECGRRFQDYYEARHSNGGSGNPIYLIVGSLVVLVGIVMLPAPGPGTVVIALGLGLLARESRTVARALDGAERKIRSWWGNRG